MSEAGAAQRGIVHALAAAVLCSSRCSALRPVMRPPRRKTSPVRPPGSRCRGHPLGVQRGRPPIGSAQALRGGTLNTSMEAYPLTFRLVGPNSNDAFAGWNRRFTQNFTLVTRHPVTDRFMPWMATHWSVQDDQRTIYFRLDRDARFSDGRRSPRATTFSPGG